MRFELKRVSVIRISFYFMQKIFPLEVQTRESQLCLISWSAIPLGLGEGGKLMKSCQLWFGPVLLLRRVLYSHAPSSSFVRLVAIIDFETISWIGSGSLHSYLVYKFTCAGYNSVQSGEATRHLSTRVSEHLFPDKSLHIFKHLISSNSCRDVCNICWNS